MTRRYPAVAAGLLAAGLLGALAPAEAATSRSGTLGKFDGVDEIVYACTTTKNFATVPQMTRTFTISGAASSVVVTFSGASSLNGVNADTGFIRLTIDNVEQTPGVVPFLSAGSRTAGRSFTWQTAPLSVGNHTARIQWRTDLGSSFCFDARSLIVHHR